MCSTTEKNVLGIVICKRLECAFKEVVFLSIFLIIFPHVLFSFHFQSLLGDVYMFSFLSQARILSVMREWTTKQM